MNQLLSNHEASDQCSILCLIVGSQELKAWSIFSNTLLGPVRIRPAPDLEEFDQPSTYKVHYSTRLALDLSLQPAHSPPLGLCTRGQNQ